MDSGTLIIAAILLALMIIPVIFIARSGKKKSE